jgi:hypothetical protein
MANRNFYFEFFDYFETEEGKKSSGKIAEVMANAGNYYKDPVIEFVALLAVITASFFF